MHSYPETLSYSSEYGETKEANVNNSLKFSQNIRKEENMVKKEEQIICTFREIIEASRDGA
jgi:hypothetical protein